MSNPVSLTILAQSGQTWSPVFVLVVLVVVVLLVMWLALRWMRRLENHEPKLEVHEPKLENHERRLEAHAPKVEKAATGMAAAFPAGVAQDDLKIIEGIGPKIAAVLCAAGVDSFTRLAGTTPDEITTLLQAGGIRLADPRSWPEQARLAAAGKQAELKAFQATLVAGRQS